MVGRTIRRPGDSDRTDQVTLRANAVSCGAPDFAGFSMPEPCPLMVPRMRADALRPVHDTRAANSILRKCRLRISVSRTRRRLYTSGMTLQATSFYGAN